MATLTDPDKGLGIYTEPIPEARISNGDDWTNPLLFTLDAVNAVIYDVRLYIGSNDEIYAYTGPSGGDITLSIVNGDGIADGSLTGWEWKLKAGDSQPTEYEWGLVTPGQSISLPPIYDPYNNMDGCTHIYHPFWLRIKIPRLTQRKLFSNTYFRITAVRQPVGWYATATGVS